MEDKIDLKGFIRIIRKRMATIIITVLRVFLLTAVYSIYFLKPTYEATENILIGELTREEGTFGDTQELSMLLASTIDFIKSPIILNSVQKELNINDDELEQKIAVQNNRNSQIINIVVRDNDLEHTKELTHAIALTSVNKMEELFGVTEITLLSAADGDPSVKQVGSLTLNIAIGIVIGFFLGIGLAMVKEYWDDSIKDVKEIETIFGLPVLGAISLNNNKRNLSRFKNKTKQQKAESLNRKNGGQISV